MKYVIRSNAARNAQHFTLTAIAHHFFEIVLHIEIWRSADGATESHHRNTIYAIIIQIRCAIYGAQAYLADICVINSLPHKQRSQLLIAADFI